MYLIHRVITLNEVEDLEDFIMMLTTKGLHFLKKITRMDRKLGGSNLIASIRR